MFNLFKPKKVYCVTYRYSSAGCTYKEIVTAVDVAHAWNKVRHRHWGAEFCLSIIEIEPEEFRGA